MKKLKLRHIYTIICILFLLFIYLSILVFPIKETADLVNFTITVISLVIAFIAFDIAMRTYVSIDSVNAINKMQGNVLENVDYTTSIPYLMKRYNMHDSKSVGKAIFNDLELLFKKRSQSAIEFANNLQTFTDVIVFFPYLFNPANEDQEHNIIQLNRILLLIDKRQKALAAVSTGNMLLIEETIKLINYVMSYQELMSKSIYNFSSSILEIRGGMLKNPVSRTIYYNYLGLHHNKKAVNILRKELELGRKDLFQLDVMEEVINNIHRIDSETIYLITMYLHESKAAFDSALSNSENDLMWNGFIQFNNARTSFLLQLFHPNETDKEHWQSLMNEAIQSRTKLNILFEDLFDLEETTYLQKAFQFEDYLAKLVSINLAIASNMDIINYNSQPKYRFPKYEGLLNDKAIIQPYTGPFNRIHKYQEQITNKFSVL